MADGLVVEGEARSVPSELGRLLILALPLAGAHLGSMAIGAVHTAVVGRLGEVELAAVGLAGSIAMTAMICGLGVMLGLDPLIAQAVGAREDRRARALFWQGIWAATIVSAVVLAMTVVPTLFLEQLGVDARAVPATRAYLWMRLPGIVFFVITVAARSYLQAYGHTWPMLVGVVVANIVNLPVTWLLVPALGVAGAGMASSIALGLQMVIVGASLFLVRVPSGPERIRRAPEWREIGRVLRVGSPIGLQLLAEVGVFAVVGILMGNLGARELAAHQVALTLASATFQVPIAFGAAASVRVGKAVGRTDLAGARLGGFTAIGAISLFMLGTALTFWLLPAPLAGIFTDQMPVVAVTVPLLLIAAVFQLSDGVQAVAAGALRGTGDTLWPLASNVVGHWVIGLPIGCVLAFALGWRAEGLWWGLTAGLTAVALALTLRFALVSSRPIARV